MLVGLQYPHEGLPVIVEVGDKVQFPKNDVLLGLFIADDVDVVDFDSLRSARIYWLIARVLTLYRAGKEY